MTKILHKLSMFEYSSNYYMETYVSLIIYLSAYVGCEFRLADELGCRILYGR